MNIMSPKEYLLLQYKILFKIVSLEKEVERWSDKKRIGIIFQSGLYNFFLGLVIITILNLISTTELFQYNLTSTVIGLSFLVVFGIILGINGMMIFGITLGFIGGVAITVAGIKSGVLIGAAYGTAIGVFTVIRMFCKKHPGVLEGIIIGTITAIIFSITFGISNVAKAFGIGLFIGVTCTIKELIGKVSYETALILSVTLVFCVAVGPAEGAAYLLCHSCMTWRLWYLPYFCMKQPPPTLAEHPIVKDENFIVPLPFLTKILQSHAEKRGVEYAKEIITFIIENRPALYKQAQDALIFITLDSMQKVTNAQELSKFAHLRESENYNKSNSLPQLGKIAYSIEKGYESKNVSNKLNIYKYTINEIRKQMGIVRCKRSKLVSKYCKTSEIWEKIIEKEIREIEQINGRPLPNPFIVGKPVKGKAFIRRDHIIEEIVNESLRDGRSRGILFVGNRRTGKSSTLLNLNEYIPASLKSVYFDFQNPQLFNSVKTFCNKVTKEIEKCVEVKPENEINDFNSLSSYFETVQNSISNRQMKLLICFDEFEKMTDKILEGRLTGLADNLKYWVEHLDNFIFLFAGGNEINEIKKFCWSDYLTDLYTVRMKYFNEDQSRLLIARSVSDFGLKYSDEELLESFLKLMGGHPYLIQAVMFNLISLLNNDNNRKLAEKGDIEDAVENCFSTTEAYFHHFWEKELNKNMRSEILNMIENRESENEEAIRPLLRKEIIKKVGNRYELCVPLIKQWIVYKEL